MNTDKQNKEEIDQEKFVVRSSDANAWREETA
jgi:hypothetical protein